MRYTFQIVSMLFMAVVLMDCNSKKINPYENNIGMQQSQLAQADKQNYTEIEWVDSIKNFGTVLEGDTIRFTYTFKNTGKTPLFITGVRSECGCTVTDYPRHIIQPGEENRLTATFITTGKKGYTRKSIRVASNTYNNIFHYLVYYGDIKIRI